MTLPLFLVALAGLIATIVIVGALIAWHPTRDHHPGAPGGIDPATVDDWCEHPGGCDEVPTHELVAGITPHEGGGSAMVATYCAEHAPAGAVRVRTLTSR